MHCYQVKRTVTPTHHPQALTLPVPLDSETNSVVMPFDLAINSAVALFDLTINSVAEIPMLVVD